MRNVVFLCSLLLGLLLLPLVRAQDVHPAMPDSNPETKDLMSALAREFRAVDEALASGKVEQAAPKAKTLNKLSGGIGRIAPQLNVSGKDEFQIAAKRAQGLAEEIMSLTAKGDLTTSMHALDELRATCVSCHYRFRDPQKVLGTYPQRKNVVAGRVSITTRKGTVRKDWSNVVVFLEGKVPASAMRPPRTNPRIEQRDTVFRPRVLPIVKGTRVDFPNDDVIYHNVFSLSKVRPFDLGAYGPKQSKEVSFPRSGLVKLHCNMHPKMISSIVVLENGFFTLTDRLGNYVISDIPDGKYTLRTWHEFGGDQKQKIMLEKGKTLRQDLKIKEDKVMVPHKNKFGRPYRAKY